MKIRMWPNKMGCRVTTGSLAIEVWIHGGLTRIVNDNSLCGFHGTHWAKIEPARLEEMAAKAISLWKNNPREWQECE